MLPVARCGALALLLATGGALADWPLVWDYDGRPDEPIAAALTPSGELLVLAAGYAQGAGAPHGILLRVATDGSVAGVAIDPDLHRPTALALAPDGRALATGRVDADTVRVTAFAATGAIDWSRTRDGVTLAFASEGPESQPVWDPAAGAEGGWRVPVGLAGGLGVVSWSAAGDPLADRSWSPPEGTATATAIAPRPGGGLLVAGIVDEPEPSWWVVALDAAGTEDWSRHEDGGTTAGIFSGAFFASPDAGLVTLWAADETHCGLPSLRLWSLDEATGAPVWDATWPPVPGCTFFEPDSVTRSGSLVVATGATTHLAGGFPTTAAAIAYEAATGELAWERDFAGETTVIHAELAAAADGAARVATTLFPPVNPGPTPLWLTGWFADGAACAPAVEIAPARVTTSLLDAGGGWLIVGSADSDVVVQRAADPCAVVFRDAFESGGFTAWSETSP